jgi:Protein of unknown function (DUF1553)/Protein of unknown function (DUF1549)
MKNKTNTSIAFTFGVLLALSAAANDTTDKAPVTARSSQLWSYRPVSVAAPPTVKDRKWVRTPIDAFVLAKIEAANLKPSPDVEKAAFIRRATLDAWGLIPTPEEVTAFESDHSKQAYEHLVDRLLASPHYGERQARHWLDLARYADSAGFQNDQTRADASRYRDYVISAFNSDKPYDQFIKEQLAGDEIPNATQQDLIATGFLVQYPDNANARDLLQRKYQITTDMVDATGAVFLGQSIGCARCHDHKFDKISEKEYFQLQAFFANTSEIKGIKVVDKGPQELAFAAIREKYQATIKPIRDQEKVIDAQLKDAAVKYQKERYLQDSQVSLFKDKSQWNALDRWVNHRWENVTGGGAAETLAYLQYVGENKGDPNYDATKADLYVKYKELDDQVKKFAKLRPDYGTDTITAVGELGSPDSPPTYKLFGGSQDRPLEEVQPLFPEAIAQGVTPHIVPTATSSGRRTALAEWIASPTNPLTTRVYVNRVWSWYFGTGIVSTVSDFGRAGQRPTHPELLDYLANEFVKNGWSTKQLTREILLSSVYRQASDARDDAYKADPDNKLLAVYPRRRMDAEEIRDSILVAAGQLNDKMGGLAVLPPLPKGMGKPRDNGFTGLPNWVVTTTTEDWNRRSIYVFTRRSVAYPMLANFDMASPNQVHSRRDVTTTPLQALVLYNDDQIFQWSQDLAGRVIHEAGPDTDKQLERLYQILFARSPDKFEKSTLKSFLSDQQKVIEQGGADGKLQIAQPIGALVQTSFKSQAEPNPLRDAAFVDLVHTLVNSNEFAYKF